MKFFKMPGTDLEASRIGLGCMRISDMNAAEVETLINVSMEEGVNFFDHADIYGGGKCEELFGEVFSANKNLRDKMIIQSKCGITNGTYNFSKEHILSSVDGILQRLKIDTLDILLLHRPDALMEPEEVAEAFNEIEKAGKVKYFGVSNQNPMQIELLKKYVKQPLIVNQLQYSITSCGMVASGMNVNVGGEDAVNRDGSVLDYCRLNDITIQAWSPFQYGFFTGTFLDNPDFPELNAVIDDLAKKYDVTNSAIAIAWILRHPMNMQPIIGTVNLERIKASCKATDFDLTREEWYAIYKAAGKRLP